MHPNANLIDKFYSSFARLDYATMISCYYPAAEFADPVFTVQGKRVGAMWHMLTAASKNFSLTYSQIEADDQNGKAHWEARYSFSTSGRPVHNVIDAEFRFRDGKIIWHRDHFDFWRWARMALGPSGVLLGWTPFLHERVRQTAAANLEKFIAAHPEYQG